MRRQRLAAAAALGLALAALPLWPTLRDPVAPSVAVADDDDDGGGGGDNDSDSDSDNDSDDGDDAGGGEADADDGSDGDDDADQDDADELDGEAVAASRDRDDGDRFVVDEVVVADGVPGFLDAVRRLGFTVLERRSLGALGVSVTRLRLPSGVAMRDAQALLRRSFPDLVFDVNSLYRAQQGFSLPPPGYARTLVGWGDASGGCGGGIVLGMIDTAVDIDHPAFDGRDLTQRPFGKGGVPAAHGTAVASILVGAGGDTGPPGLLPGATLKVAAAFSDGGEGGLDATAFDIVSALDWLVASGATTVNLSLAGGPNRLLGLALDRTAAQGVVTVAAVGNGGPAAPPAYPAARPSVIAATAVDQRSRAWPGANRGGYVDFAAPGVQIAAASGRFEAFFTGTSFAAPFVTAAAALRQAALTREGGAGDVDSVRRRLAGSAIDLGPPGRDDIYGEGLIQAGGSCR